MMNNHSPFMTLLAMQLRQRLGLSVMRQRIRERRAGLWKSVGIGAVVVVSMGTLIGFYTWLVHAFGRMLASAGLESILPLVGISGSMLATLVAGTAFLLSILYLNRDAEALSALPVSSRTVFAVKITQALLGEAATSIPLAWPVFIVFGIVTKAGAFYYVKAVIVWLCALSLPLMLAALITLPLMRWSALWRRREQIAVVGGFALMIAFLVGEMWLSSRLSAMLEGGALLQWMMGRVDLFDRIAGAIPPLWLSLRALTGTSIASVGYLAALVALSAMLGAAAMWLAGKVYQAGVSAQTESHFNLKSVDFDGRIFKRRSPRIAVMIREAKLTLRTPVYAMNIVTLVVVFPVMIVGMFLVGGSTNELDVEAMLALLERFFYDPWMIALLIAGLSMILGCMNTAASTSISREGRMFIWARVSPVPYDVQAEGKLVFALALSWLQSLFVAVSLGLSLRLPTAGVVAGFLLSVPGVIPAAVIQMSVDILHPKLLWTNPVEAVKQNMNLMLGMVFAAIYSAALIVPSAVLIIRAGVSTGAVYAVMCAISVIMSVAARMLLRKVAREGYARVEI
jgi:ABC-2 type transport system permease protein